MLCCKLTLKKTRKEHLESKLSQGNQSLEITLLRTQGPSCSATDKECKSRVPCASSAPLTFREGDIRSISQWWLPWNRTHFGGASPWQPRFRSRPGHTPACAPSSFVLSGRWLSSARCVRGGGLSSVRHRTQQRCHMAMLPWVPLL